jgi:hypothetical protein
MYNLYEVILIGDQPTTCPKCGARTEIVLSLDHTIEKTQFHKCLFESCKYEFVAEEYLDIEYQL